MADPHMKWEFSQGTGVQGGVIVPREGESQPEVVNEEWKIKGEDFDSLTPGQFLERRVKSLEHRVTAGEKRLLVAVLQEAVIDATGHHGIKLGSGLGKRCARCHAWWWLLSKDRTNEDGAFAFAYIAEIFDIEPRMFTRALKALAPGPWGHPEDAKFTKERDGATGIARLRRVQGGTKTSVVKGKWNG